VALDGAGLVAHSREPAQAEAAEAAVATSAAPVTAAALSTQAAALVTIVHLPGIITSFPISPQRRLS